MQIAPETESNSRNTNPISRLVGVDYTAKASQIADKIGAAYLSWQLPWLLIGLGIILRLAHYLGNRSLRYDEAGVTLNIVNRSLPQLMEKLDGFQVAPPAFLAIEKLAVLTLGTSELALRLFPLLAGIASLFLFYAVAKAFLRPRAVPIALGLFSISHLVVRFASEVKQYSSDVAVSLLIIYLAYRVIRSGFSIRWVITFAIVGSATVWFSHSSVFVLAGVGTVIVLHSFRNHPWTRLIPLIAMIGVWLFSFGFIYTGQSGHSPLDNPGHIYNFSPLFLPFPPTSPADVEWYFRTFFKAFHIPGGILLSGVAAFAFILGGIGMVGRSSQRKGFDKRILFALLASPFLFTIAVSAIGLYPLPGPEGFGGRLSLFLVPMAFLLIGEGTEYFREKLQSTGLAPSYLVLVALLFIFPLLSAADKVTELRGIEEMRPLVGYILDNREPDDTILVLRPPQYSFSFYAQEQGLVEDEYGIYYRTGLIAALQAVRAKQEDPRVWIVLGHNTVDYDNEEQALLIESLDKAGTRLDYFSAPEVQLFLYEF